MTLPRPCPQATVWIAPGGEPDSIQARRAHGFHTTNFVGGHFCGAHGAARARRYAEAQRRGVRRRHLLQAEAARGRAAAVLIEGICVAVLNASIARDFRGGMPAFQSAIPNVNHCTDGEVTRVGFMAPPDVRAFVEQLEGGGLLYVGQDGNARTIAVVDQREGFMRPCNWLLFERAQIDADPTHIGAICRAIPSTVESVAVPASWNFANSLTARHRFILTEQVDDELEFLRREDGVDVYRDRRTGQELYVGRTTP